MHGTNMKIVFNL